MADELSTLPRLSGLVSLLTQFHLFPEAWIYGQLFVLNNLQREAYLLGAYSDHGFWLYFPVAFAVKTPLPTLILFLVTLILWGTKKLDRAKVNFPLVALASYFLLAILSRLSIGVRHILPIYPFLFVLVGGTVGATPACPNSRDPRLDLVSGVMVCLVDNKHLSAFSCLF